MPLRANPNISVFFIAVPQHLCLITDHGITGTTVIVFIFVVMIVIDVVFFVVIIFVAIVIINAIVIVII